MTQARAGSAGKSGELPSGRCTRTRGEAMAKPTGLEASERYMAIALRWFTEGWVGNLAMAADIFSEELRTNGVHVGASGPVARIRDRLTGFPDLATSIEDMFVSGDKLAEIGRAHVELQSR